MPPQTSETQGFGRRSRLSELAYFAGEYATVLLAGHKYPGRLMRLVYRFPVWLYRKGLGWLVSDSTLLLTTTGRKSGKPRYAALGYHYHEPTDTHYVMSGWPERSDWYRNIAADPRVRVSVGRREFDSVAEAATESAALELLTYYNERNPFAASLWKATIGEAFDGSEEALCDAAKRYPAIALRPERAEQSQ